jgi:cobalt-precorrin-5B (C1)-methyltransferase
VTIGGGFGKITKLAQGAMDLHSGRSQVDFNWLAKLVPAELQGRVQGANTALQVLELAGEELAKTVAREALRHVNETLKGATTQADVIIVARDGRIIAHAS